MEFKKDMKIFDILLKDKRSIDVFKKYNMKCSACSGAYEDTLEMACSMSGVPLDNVLKDLNNLNNSNEKVRVKQEI